MEKTTGNFLYTTPDGAVKYEFVFIRGRQFRMTHLGKCWPVTTQCLLFRNGFLMSHDTIVKHELDTDNPLFATRLVAKNVMSEIPFRETRKDIWTELDKFLSETYTTAI